MTRPAVKFGSLAGLLLAAVVAAPIALSAQNTPWGRSPGMAGADYALARGFGALEWNPAHLFADGDVGLSVGTSIHGGRVLVTGADVRQLADILRAAGSGDASLLDGVPAEGLHVDAFSESATATLLADILDLPDPADGTIVPSFGLTYENVGFVYRQETVVSGEVSRELVDLAVNGFNPEQINEYAARSTGLRSHTVSSLTFGGSREYGRLRVGLGLRYVLGRKLVRAQVFEPEVDVDSESILAATTAVESRGGSGGGLDFGMTYRIGDRGFVSASIQNLWQRMLWDEDLFYSQADFDQNDLGGTDVRLLLERFRPQALDPQGTTLEAYETSSRLLEETFLPRVVRAGIGWHLTDGLDVQVMGAKTLGEGKLIPAQMDRAAAGLEQRLGPIALRLGAALEENGARQLSGGLGLSLAFVRLDLAAGWTRGRGSTGPTQEGFSASVGFGIVFDSWDAL